MKRRGVNPVRIDPDKELAGYVQVKIRDLLRKANQGSESWKICFISENLHISREETIKVVRALEKEGLIIQARDRGIYKRNPDKFQKEELTEWELTDKGRRFAKASTEGISRDEADKIISTLPTRIEQINQNPEFVYTIRRAFIFGSYVETDDQCLGDVDIALELEPKENDPQKQQEREEVRRSLARESGKINSLQDFECWPKNEVYNFLQEGLGHLDFERVEFVCQEKLKHRVLYP